jgi:hypothetical protein
LVSDHGLYYHIVLDTGETGFVSKYTGDHAEQLSRPDVKLGMRIEDILESRWGRPEHVVTKTSRAGRVDKLIYTTGVLYLTNGVLTEITRYH